VLEFCVGCPWRPPLQNLETASSDQVIAMLGKEIMEHRLRPRERGRIQRHTVVIL
jgi:hypothetical protein